MDMDRHLWRERLLFLIAPSADDPIVVRQREALNERADALNDRDLKLFPLFEQSPSLFVNSQLSDREVRELRARLKIDPGSKAKH